MMGPHKKDQLDPQDMKNMLLFFVLATVIYLAYNTFILKPQAEALKQAQQAATAQNIAGAPGLDSAAGPQEPLARNEALAASPRLVINTPRLKGSISLRGGLIDDLAFKDYYETLEEKVNVVLLSPRDTAYPRFANFGWVGADDGLRTPDDSSLWSAQGNTALAPGAPVTLRWSNGLGLTFEREIAIDDEYMMTITQRVRNETGRAVTLYPYGLVSQSGLPQHLQNMWVVHEGPIGFIGDQLVEHDYADLRKNGGEALSAQTGWIGITDKYWLSALLPAQDQNAKFRFARSGPVPGKKEKDLGRYQTDFTGAGVTIDPGATGESVSHFFAGPKKVLMLADYGEKLGVRNFDLAVDFGWFWFMSKPFFHALHFLHEHLGNMGVAIILLTIAIRTAVFPLTNASFKSFAKMKKVTPQITALREEYADDKQKMQQELVKMYEREGVNPMAGCFPILLQIPIFFALYKVLVVTIEMRHAPFFGWIQDLSAPDPTNIFTLFGLLEWDAPGFLHVGVWPCMMLLVMLVQKKLNPPPQDPIQRDMNNYFPFLITYMLAKFASGLVIYWTFSAFISMLQQMVIMHRMGVPIYLFGQSPEEKKLEKAVDKGPALHPLAEMAEDQVEDALFGAESESEPAKPLSKPKPKRKAPAKPKKKK